MERNTHRFFIIIILVYPLIPFFYSRPKYHSLQIQLVDLSLAVSGLMGHMSVRIIGGDMSP